MQYYLKLLAFIFVALVIVGLCKNYSAVPYWDMWPGAVDFYVKVHSGDHSQWFALHNEHRITLAKILFWLDFYFFDGRQYFLLIVNFLLMSLSSLLFIKIAKNLFPDEEKKHLRKMLYSFIPIVIFSWLQKENITWAFQSQFFLAYLLPLFSFYCLAKFKMTSDSYYYFLAVITAIAAAFTMANGILALPLLVILGLIYKVGSIKNIICILTTLIVLLCYFYDYKTSEVNESLLASLLQHPKEFILYFLTFLGGPFYYIFGKITVFFAVFFGVGFILLSGLFMYKYLKESSKNPMPLVLLFFIVYVGGTAFATAGGRIHLGFTQALSSRYLTPQLMAWLSMFLLGTFYYRYTKQKILLSVLFIIPLTLFPYQLLEIRKDRTSMLFSRELAALALELEVNDTESVGRIYPNMDRVMELATYPRVHNLSIFGHPKFKDVNEKIGTGLKSLKREKILGDIVSVKHIELKIYQIKGWLYNDKNHSVPPAAFIVNDENIILGYVITGEATPQNQKKYGEKAIYSGYIGYVKGFVGGSKLRLVSSTELFETAEFLLLEP